jgi:hypothetical protein
MMMDSYDKPNRLQILYQVEKTLINLKNIVIMPDIIYNIFYLKTIYILLVNYLNYISIF